MEFWTVMCRAADGVDIVPRAELEADVVHDAIGGLEETEAIVARAGGVAAGANADVAADDIGLARKRNFAARETDAAAGRGLAGDSDIATDAHGGFQRDITADIEDDDAAGFAHGIAERAGAAIGERGDVINRSTATARCRRSRNHTRRETREHWSRWCRR